MASALEGFLKLECDDLIAGWLRGAAAESPGAGYDEFGFNLFDVELFHAENRVTIREIAALGYEDAELPLTEFIEILPDVPPTAPPRDKREPSSCRLLSDQQRTECSSEADGAVAADP